MNILAHPANIITAAMSCALVTWLFWSILVSAFSKNDEVGE